jgi:hypothetical protein
MTGQRRGHRIAMSPEEIDTFLAAQRICRLATGGPAGPHVAPLWFFWDGRALWLNSLVRSQRWTDLQRDPRVAVVVDAGEQYHELRGVEVIGQAVVVGEAPRVGTTVPELDAVELGFHHKYRDPAKEIVHDGRHGWLRVDARKLRSWDFRKMCPPLPGRDDEQETSDVADDDQA